MSKKQQQQDERNQAIALIRKWLRPGATVWTVVKHVSYSGMSRRIQCLIVRKGEIQNISAFAARACGMRFNPDEGSIVVGGCGMDMGFHVVYELGRNVFPDGFKLPRGKMGRNGDKSGHDGDGGYALNHRWL